ncbi:MFS transporter [Sporolactobacillus laevolacticus]|uniref:MFS transporter n=1 Tax=Sporolactobacillus laevolacticus DSM 442 TaxID=1395513 RepID=V6J5Y3_9BACL|nr:MFS transporter [Sporolactobacillus laevolacticus]EST12159.1 MFS transporter [Sporolactobacillus laevolacticus DSM 442]
MKTTFAIFKNKQYSLLFTASVASQLGSIIGMTALVFYFLSRFSHQPYLATVNELMFSLPALIVFWIVGVAADRLDRQKIASNCDWISALLSLALLGAVLWGQLNLIFSIIFLRAAVSKFFAPAEQAILQGILQKGDYAVAAGLNQMVSSVFMIFGNGLGAIVYWHFGVQGAILIDALSFVLSALLIRIPAIRKEVRQPNGAHDWKTTTIKSIITDFNQGFLYIIKDKLLTSLVGSFAIFGIINGGCSVMLIFILKYKLVPDVYELFSVWTGIIAGAGILIGSLIASVCAGKCRFRSMIITGLLASGLFMVAAGYVPTVYLFFVMIFFSTLLIPLVNVAIGGWMPHIVDPKMMGRVESWSTPILMFSQSLTLGFITFAFPRLVSIETIFLIIGSVTVLSAVYYLFFVPSDTIEERTVVEPINGSLEAAGSKNR